MALKIYELGLKKFGCITEYIMSYIDFMSHLNGKFHQSIIGDNLTDNC